ncbi:type II secretion system protein [Nocardioides cheoyonin]|uniref:type II secretion system protein n=1 Tax=Nocardioides cheoyonin TaxID=3156615 RepID=UPI003CCC7F13
MRLPTPASPPQQRSRLNATGFTLVELLIVIVVIAILAAISLVAYNGIQDRAHDAAIRSDLANFREAIQVHMLEVGASIPPPTNGLGSSLTTELASLGWKATQSAYDTSVARNVIYCYSEGTAPDEQRTHYALVALSKSGNAFYVTDTTGPTTYSASVSLPFDASEQTCSILSSNATSVEYTNRFNGWFSSDTTTGPWRAWTSGVSQT